MLTTKCQLCAAAPLKRVIDLGYHPLADTFLSPAQLNEEETTYPLRVLLCEACGYATLEYIVDATTRYQKTDYSYTFSNSPVAVKHFQEMAGQIVDKVKVSEKDLVVDIGSNVGTLLEAFRSQTKCAVTGIEPAGNIARLANEQNVPTINDFFTKAVAEKLASTQKAKAITATNVFNHITDLTTFMESIAALLADDGSFVFETPYLLDLYNNTSFDTIYLEHVSYFGIKPLARFFKKFGLAITHIETNSYMGGSMRVYVGRQAESGLVAEYIAREEAAQLYHAGTYSLFMDKIQAFKFSLNRRLSQIKAEGGKIIGIGAATKGNTLLNFCKIDYSTLEFIAESSALKIGKFTPGSHIPIQEEKDITPDIKYGLILPWNIGQFLKEKLKHLNLEFIIPEIK